MELVVKMITLDEILIPVSHRVQVTRVLSPDRDLPFFHKFILLRMDMTTIANIQRAFNIRAEKKTASGACALSGRVMASQKKSFFQPSLSSKV